MNIYLLILIAPFIIHFIVLVLPINDKKRVELVLNSIILILVVGFRHVSVGSDTIRYTEHFGIISNFDFKQAIDASIKHEAPLYVFFAWLVSRFVKSVTAYFCMIAFVHFSTFAYLIYKRSVNIPLSYFIYITLFLTLQLSGVKNCLAVSVLFLALDFALDRRIKPFILMIIIAFLFHRTTLIFALVYPIIHVRKLNLNIIKYSVLFVLMYIFRVQVSSVLKAVGGYEDYGVHDARPWMMTLLCFLFVIFSVLMNRNYGSDYEFTEYKNLLMISMIASIFMPLVFVNPSALRIVRYFLISNIVLIPRAFKNLELQQKNRHLIWLVLSIFIIFIGYYFIRNVNSSIVYHYRFFWE